MQQVWVCVQIDPDDGMIDFEFIATSLERIKAEVADYVGLNRDDLKDRVSLRWEDDSRFDSPDYHIGYCIDNTRAIEYRPQFHVYQQEVLE